MVRRKNHLHKNPVILVTVWLTFTLVRLHSHEFKIGPPREPMGLAFSFLPETELNLHGFTCPFLPFVKVRMAGVNNAKNEVGVFGEP